MIAKRIGIALVVVVFVAGSCLACLPKPTVISIGNASCYAPGGKEVTSASLGDRTPPLVLIIGDSSREVVCGDNVVDGIEGSVMRIPSGK